jgi:hypothetical protein
MFFLKDAVFINKNTETNFIEETLRHLKEDVRPKLNVRMIKYTTKTMPTNQF